MEKLTFMQKTKTFIINHKFWSAVILIAIILGAYFFIFKSKASTETRYVTSVVAKGSVITSVSGSGQIEASDTINLKTKASGDINYIGVSAGQTVRKGQLIASIDSRDAKLALENAQIALDKLVQNPDTLTLTQKQNSLDKSYSDGWNLVSSAILDMNPIIDGLQSLYSNGYLGFSNIMVASQTTKDKVALGEKSYYDAKDSLDSVTNLFKILSRTSDKKDIENLISKMYDTTKVVANSMKITQSAFDAVVNSRDEKNTSKVNTIQSDLTSWTSSANNYVGNLLSSTNSIVENTQSLSNFVAGASDFDIRSASLTVENKQAAYNDCFLYAPFDGVIATFTAKVGDSSSILGTLITQQENATISLNEVDIAKIKLGQKVTLTFDAIDGLTITGKVAAIDSVGTVSQGVVTYNVVISLDVKDARVKPGMSISANIITDVAQDVIVVPNSAIKTGNGGSYVEIFSKPLVASSGTLGSTSAVLPTQIQVLTGLVDDANTEIISGLKEGDIIVTKTTTATVAKTTNSAPSILGAVGGNRTGGGGGGGAAFRAVRGD